MSDELLDELKREKEERLPGPLTREGNYGNHLTYTGKICYNRRRHWFTRKDWERIGKKYMVPVVEEYDSQALQAHWWMEVLRKYTIDMMEEIFALPGLRAIDLDAESIYQQSQEWGSRVGLSWADELYRQGRFETAQLVRELFEQRTWKP